MASPSHQGVRPTMVDSPQTVVAVVIFPHLPLPSEGHEGLWILCCLSVHFSSSSSLLLRLLLFSKVTVTVGTALWGAPGELSQAYRIP